MQTTHLILFVLILILCYVLGAYYRSYLSKKGIEKKGELGTVATSMLALFAFFLGFTFSISASKIERVRETTIQEANTIGTALLRTQLYPDTIEIQLKGMFKDYLRNRLNYFNNTEGQEDAKKYLNETSAYGQKIWNKGVDLQKTKQYPEESRLFLPAVNEMLDSVSSRDSVITAQMPPIIFNTLFILSFCTSFIIGYGMKKKLLTNFIAVLYILAISLTVNLIIDASNPRSGAINTKKANSVIEHIYEQL